VPLGLAEGTGLVGVGALETTGGVVVVADAAGMVDAAGGVGMGARVVEAVTVGTDSDATAFAVGALELPWTTRMPTPTSASIATAPAAVISAHGKGRGGTSGRVSQEFWVAATIGLGTTSVCAFREGSGGSLGSEGGRRCIAAARSTCLDERPDPKGASA
jgi:hypothetical protein